MMARRALCCLALALLLASASAVQARGGFDTLARLISQIENNIAATHRVTEAKWVQDWRRCNETLRTMGIQVEARWVELQRANDSLNRALATIDSVQQQIAPVQQQLVLDRLDVSRAQSELDKLRKERDDERDLNAAKLKDTTTIIIVVEKVLEQVTGLLEQKPGTTFRFAETLQRAAAGIKDKLVAKLVASALQTIAQTPKTSENLKHVQSLLRLLVVELTAYKDEVNKQDTVAQQQFEPIAAELTKRLTAANAKLQQRLSDLANLQRNISAQNQTVSESTAVLNGPLAAQHRHLKREYDTQKMVCDTKASNIEAERRERSEQNQTIFVLKQVVANQAENSQALEGIDDVQIPQPTACCRVCQGDTVACGDECVARERTVGMRCMRGCACDLDDPRTAATSVRQG